LPPDAATATLVAMTGTWAPSTWRDRPAAQQPAWPDDGALEASLKHLATLPPLVFAGEARNLTASTVI
jgi:3-deoxy-7-phosphoheptulonate synthase